VICKSLAQKCILCVCSDIGSDVHRPVCKVATESTDRGALFGTTGMPRILSAMGHSTNTLTCGSHRSSQPIRATYALNYVNTDTYRYTNPDNKRFLYVEDKSVKPHLHECVDVPLACNQRSKRLEGVGLQLIAIQPDK